MEKDINLMNEVNNLAMSRNAAFWKREMAEEILAEFGAEDEVTLSPTQTTGAVSEKYPPLFDDVPKMLRDFEKSITTMKKSKYYKIFDDKVKIPIAWPELQFGNGMAGAIFGGKLEVTSTKDHTYTFNEPVIKNWNEVYGLKFDKNNIWVRRILEALKYFVKNSTEDFLVLPFFIYEGADFIVSMRGTTQAFYDLIDYPPELQVLYDLGRKTGIEFFEMKREIIKKHNERILNNKEYSDLAPIHSVPLLDMDAYALCSPEIFEKIGFENKQKILNHFKGGSFYIHALGRHILPIAARLENLTQLWLYDDPKCPRYFENRISLRKTTFDIPLQMYCSLKEFISALNERSLPGGIKYNIFTSGEKISTDEINLLLKKIKSYRTRELAAKSKK
ncbi:MAG: hypothetical protein M1475_06900 [Actinobacteria bacterium]|nr:hypothetical protein [Actinomycetota bacterium]